MLDLREARKDHDKSRPLHVHNNLHSFVTDSGAFITKSGEVGAVLRCAGPDVENAEPERIDAITLEVTSALKAFGPEFVVSTYFLKSSNPSLAVPDAASSRIDRVVRDRIEYLERKGSARFSFEMLIVVLLEPKWEAPNWRDRFAAWASGPRKALRRSLRVESKVESLDETLQDALKTLDEAIQAFIQRAGTLSLRLLNKSEAFTFIRRLWNPDREKALAVELANDLHVDFYSVDSVLECHRDHLRLDDYFIKTLTLKRPPVHTFANILRELQRVPADMAVVTEWSVLENAAAISAIRSKRRHWHSTKTSLLTHVGGGAPDPLNDDSKAALVADLGACLTDVEMNGVQVGWFSLTVVLLGRTLDSVQRAGAEVMRVFGSREASLNEERYNGLNAFLAALPGGHHFNVRRVLVTNLNHGDLCPWYLPSEGERRNEFLKRDYLLALETEDRSILYLNLHHGDVGHTAVFGPTGTGKSFLLNCLLTHFQAYQPYTFIFGLGGDFRWLTQYLGGAYLQCRPNRLPFRMNPFGLEPTERNIQFQFSFAKLLAEGHDFRLNDTQGRELFEAIGNLKFLPRELQRLSTLATTVSKSIGDRLKPWTEGEQYGSWFDHVGDDITRQRVQCFDFEEMGRLGRELEAALFYLLHRADDVVYDDGLLTTLKVFFIDEAWRFFRHPVTKAYITEALKTWRKKNGCVVLSTQSVEDLADTDVLRPVVESCPTKLLLSNPTLNELLYADVLRLTPTEQARVRTLAPKRQLLLKRDGFSKVLNLNVDPRSYWLFTTDPFEAKKREELVAQLGLDAALDLLKGESPR